MSKPLDKTPNGWGNNSLTAYFENYRSNQYATFANKGPAVADLIGIDELFELFLRGAINPRPFVPMEFLLRAHAAFRAAVGAVMAGQLYEVQALLRLCLEHGSYGFYIGADQERWERWMARNDNSATKQAVREEFTHGKIKKALTAASNTIGGHFETLYDVLIDFGAHPNEQGFSMSSAIHKVDGDAHFNTIYLHGDGLPLDLGLKRTAQVGLCALHIAQLIYPARFELLGIKDKLAELRTRY